MIMLKQTLKALYILALVGIFINYFGIPNFEKLLEEKTIFLARTVGIQVFGYNLHTSSKTVVCRVLTSIIQPVQPFIFYGFKC